ncbi:MAG: cytochrome-c oxidase, cbb3-type subunit II [Burkholderiales bacterium]|jgi:cytochrome c oxidase cbb3-type subunit 2|nr:cytochrome-c oxidase, cbb3-type subunit II [Burkholderiales bacterium]
MKFFSHETLETKLPWLIIGIVILISIGGLVQIPPLFFQSSTTEPVLGLKPYTALQLEGRDVYIREGCHGCHSQMIRPFRSEAERYGHYSVAGEFIYDHPFQFSSHRRGPDLARIGGKFSDDWHRLHMIAPRAVVPESNMPNYPWLDKTPANGKAIAAKMKALRILGVPYTDADITAAPGELAGKTEMDALIAYMQGLGIHVKSVR